MVDFKIKKEILMNFWKLSIVLAAFSFSAAVFADTAATTAPAAPTAATQTKFSVKEAKAECLKDDATLKGKALRKCIRSKRTLASKHS